MNTSKKTLGLSQTAVAIAMAAGFPFAYAQEGGGIAPAPENSVSVGVGVTSGDSNDRTRFGLYNGLRKHDVNGLFGFNYSNRDAASGRWLTIQGHNIGLDNREFGLSYRWLGDMKVNVDYSELVRHDPRTINTSLQGAGSTTPIIPAGLITPGTGQDLNLELKRKSLGLLAEKQYGPFQLEVSFKNENKDGARYFGKGFGCSATWNQAYAICPGNTSASAVLMLPEPVDSTIRQFDARLNYSSQKLTLSAAYYGSFYTNNNGAISPTINLALFGNQNGGTIVTPAAFRAVMAQPVALPPDNQSHQLSLAGNYAFSPKTRMNFKYAYTRATQDESFGGAGLGAGPGGRDNLGGRIDWTKAQVGFSSAPFAKLHVHGDLAYDSKRNKTPLDFYNRYVACVAPNILVGRTCRNATNTANANVVASNPWTNGNASPKKWDAKLEASYKLPQYFLLVGGVKYEHEDFGTWTPTDVAGGVTGLKQKLEETSYRVEVRKTMSEAFTGSVSFNSARRKGDSPWLLPGNIVNNNATGVREVSDAAIYSRTAIFPFIYMDRKRDKLRFLGNWTPMEQLSLQFFLDDGKDTYSAPTEHGLRSSKSQNLSVDAVYTISDAWKLSAYGSRGKQTIDAGHSTGYDAILQDTATSLGIGVRGTPTARLRGGGDLPWIHDRLRYQQAADIANPGAAAQLALSGGLPDVIYRLTRLNLYGEYTLQKNAYVRVDFIHHRTFFNEWTYRLNGLPFLYSDNTTINAQEKQSASFVGASYIYKFQ